MVLSVDYQNKQTLVMFYKEHIRKSCKIPTYLLKMNTLIQVVITVTPQARYVPWGLQTNHR